MRILIIEDEVMSAEDLGDMLMLADPEITITEVLSSVKEAVTYLKKHADFDLIFSDIQLGDGLSFEIFQAVPVSVPVIFCTAYDRYAVEAFNTNGIGYVLKPFDNRSVLSALNKYQQLKDNFKVYDINYDHITRQLSGNAKSNFASILIYQKDKVIPVKIDDVAVFYLEHEITNLVCLNRKAYTVSQKMDELEALGGSSFFRVNRQYLINRAAVKDAEVYFNRKYVVNLTVELADKVIVSKNRVTAFFAWLSQC